MSGVRHAYAGALKSITASTTVTMLQITAAANHRVKIEKLTITGNSVDATDVPALWQLILQTSAGTSAAATLRKLDEDASETLETTARDLVTAEPTDGGVVLWSKLIGPLPANSYDLVFPPMRELYVSGGSRLGLRCVLPADTNSWLVSGQFDE